MFLDKKQRRRVLDLKVHCDKKANGCDWMGGLGELEQHLSEKCELVFVDCQYNCGESVERRFLSKHTTNNCPKRPHSCDYCLLEGTYQEIQDDHLPVCSKYPVECPNECGVAPPERGQLEGHLRECPLVMVECELKELGCEKVVQRKDADKHMEQAAQKHLRLSTSYFIKNQKRQDEAIAKLQNENEKLRSELKQLFKEQQVELFAVANKGEKISAEMVKEIESKSKELSVLSSRVDTLTRYVGTSCTSMTVKYKETNRWTNSEQFQTFPTGYIMKVNLYFNNFKGTLDIELTPVSARAIDKLDWPKTFTMTATMFNQAGNHNNYQIIRDLEVRMGHYNDEIQINYNTIEKPSHGVKYIINGHVKFQIVVEEK